ncbi:UNVERIFIED_CONTAM: hypothetical protein Sindi_2484100 [Sesamum indicum]
MSSSSSSNSKLRSGSKPRSGSGSSSSHSESAFGSSFESGSGSSSRSGSRSVSKSSHGSYTTSPKRNKKFPVGKLNDEQTGPSTLAKFQDRLAKNPWEAVVSKVRVPVHKIREKYHIPSDFDVVIPATFDRMHRPPEGFSAFSIKHLDAGLRFPLAPPWTKYKPIPKMSGGGLEGDQIKSLTSSKYDPKKLLTEKVLQLSGLSPASLHIEESLDSIIMSSRTAMRRIAS